MGTYILASTTSKPSSSSATSLIIIVLVFAVMMLFMFRSQSRRRRATQSTQRQVMNGARIRTVHGIFGTVVDGDDRNVMVEVAPGVKIKMLRQAIGQVLPDDEPDGILHTLDDEGSAAGGDASAERSEESSDVSR